MTHTNCEAIGITGGIATGKSTVSDFIRDKGYCVIDADRIAKSLMEKGNIIYEKTVEYFGQDILDKSREIDRKILGERVFSDPKLIKILNSITHPLIFGEIKNRLEESCRKDKVVFLDIPLLFEEYDNISSHEIDFDEIWLVYADRETQIERLMKRNNFTKKESIKRVDAQMYIDTKKEKSSKIIYNLDSIEDLKKNINLLLESL